MRSFTWPDTISEAKVVQLALQNKVKITPLQKTPTYIAGVDASFPDNHVLAVACLYRYPALSLVEETVATREVSFPYVPGFLSFREGPAIIDAIHELTVKPDIILVDGQGIAHPKGMGIASHIGVLVGIPTIGCAKSRLVGEFKEPGLRKGSWSPLQYDGKIVGAVLRTRAHVRPLFVSPGHRVDLKSSIEIVLGCTGNYRIPEPLRRADLLSKKHQGQIPP